MRIVSPYGSHGSRSRRRPRIADGPAGWGHRPRDQLYALFGKRYMPGKKMKSRKSKRTLVPGEDERGRVVGLQLPLVEVVEDSSWGQRTD